MNVAASMYVTCVLRIRFIDLLKLKNLMFIYIYVCFTSCYFYLLQFACGCTFFGGKKGPIPCGTPPVPTPPPRDS